MPKSDAIYRGDLHSRCDSTEQEGRCISYSDLLVIGSQVS